MLQENPACNGANSGVHENFDESDPFIVCQTMEIAKKDVMFSHFNVSSHRSVN